MRDLSPHPKTDLEWWYFHGFFDSENGSRKYFMLTLFKTEPIKDQNESVTGFACLSSIFDTENNDYRVSSIIDQSFYKLFMDKKDGISETNIDHRILDIFYSDIKIYGPPESIKLSDDPVSLQQNPFYFKWGSLEIKTHDKSITLSLPLEEESGLTRLTLEAKTHYYKVPKFLNKELSMNGMEYIFYPNMKLDGSFKNEEIHGKAWFDHQWGDFGWLKSLENENRVMGWDWFGINLDDKSSLLIAVHKDLKYKQTLVQYIVYIRDEKEYYFSDFSVDILDWWTSKRTSIKYPSKVRILIPAINAALCFEPVTKNQEIPFLGPMRAIWQGAGIITGTIGDNKVSGYGRMELNGYGYIFDLKQHFKEQIKYIDNTIEGFFPKRLTRRDLKKYIDSSADIFDVRPFEEMLSIPIWDLFTRGGKRWRSIFTQLLFCSLGKDSTPFEELLFCITELNHTGSLIIDDIEDNSSKRRGKKSIHLLYGNSVALNAANTLYFLPNLLISKHPELDEHQKNEIYKLMIRGYVNAHFGQSMDLYWSEKISRNNLRSWLKNDLSNKILEMYRLKTAGSIRFLAEIAVVIAQGDNKIRKSFSRFADSMGIAFQIIDDIHNFSNSSKWKKTPGEDLIEGKLTYVIVKSLSFLKKSDVTFIMDLLCSPALRSDKKLLKKGIELIRQSGALEHCREEARDLFKKAWITLSKNVKQSDAKIRLHILSSYLLNLNFN